MSKRSCFRCGHPIRRSEHANVIYCSEKCSAPTVEDFYRLKRAKEEADEQAAEARCQPVDVDAFE